MQISFSDGVILLVGALVFLIGWLYGRKQKASPSKSRSSQFGARHSVDRTTELIRACYGDRSQANRLTQYERDKFPGISHTEAVGRALERLMQDRVR
jgi:hypothetical protein